MRTLAMALALAVPGAAGCAETQATAESPAGTRHVPAKCTACHLAPKEHSLQADRWPEYLRRHQRRLRISDEEKAFLYDYLVGGTAPPAPGG